MQRQLLALSTLSAAVALAGCQRAADAPAALVPMATASAKPAEASASAVAAPAIAPTPAAAAAAATNAYTLAATGKGFSTGPIMSAHTVYVFFDTTCPHCAQLWTSAQAVSGKLKIVWMPIGLLRPQSLPQGATILSAADPAAAMAENEASVLARGNGITASGSLKDEVVAQVKANTEIFRKMNSDSVPLIVFRNSRTGEVGQHAGAVDAAQLLAFTGL
jgi:thiol:disulfide interchange protein DsbG